VKGALRHGIGAAKPVTEEVAERDWRPQAVWREAAAGAVAMGTGAFLTSQADDDAGQHALVN
jgi:hypothetical protein